MLKSLELVMVITQRKYALDFLHETCMSGSKPIDSPVDSHVFFGEGSSSIIMRVIIV